MRRGLLILTVSFLIARRLVRVLINGVSSLKFMGGMLLRLSMVWSRSAFLNVLGEWYRVSGLMILLTSSINCVLDRL